MPQPRVHADPAQLDQLFFALADAQRRHMLERLSRAPASVSELAEPLQIALPSAVKHLAVLERGGFVRSTKTGRVRTYEAEPAALATMQAWLERHKAQLHTQFDRLEAYLGSHKKGPSRR